MIMPIGDDNRGRGLTPLVTYTFIALNVFVFVFLQGMGMNNDFTYAFSTVPEEILTGRDVVTEDRTAEDPVSGTSFTIPGLRPTPGPVYLTLLTAMFMHGGLAHLFGNMLFLWIFGDNLEAAMRHPRYVAFYLTTGLVASLAHVFATQAFDGNLLVPSLGASGAISGVLGGYVVLFPHRRVRVLMFRRITEVPAYVAIGMWFLFQVINGIGALGAGSQLGGVAYAAHIGGFVAGLVLVKLFAVSKSPRLRTA